MTGFAFIFALTLAAAPAPQPLAGLFCPGPDLDGDGYGDTCDCNDVNPAIYPLAPQICGDGLNNDCWQYWPYLVSGTGEEDSDGDGHSPCEGDCNDHNRQENPRGPEVCDGFDNDCDGRLNAPMTPDEDGDGYSASCADCDDHEAAVYRGAPQVCGDGLNNNCVSATWPALTGTNETDDDGDGLTECAGDCDDQRSDIYPGRPEVCDGLDNDCDGRKDSPMTPDMDGDGYSPTCGDCDDANPTVYPHAPQICGDGLNNDCSNSYWPSLNGTGEVDHDGDGFTGCEGDCVESDADIYPGAPQICDRLNNDCLNPWPAWPQAPQDERDLDGDGQSPCEGDCADNDYMTRAGGIQYCDGKNNDCRDPAWPVTPANEADADGDGDPICRDCDDADARVRPGGAQTCGDGVNNDCWHAMWPALTFTNEADDDGDGMSECAGDCQDTDPRIYAGAAQLCDGINNDCDSPSWPSVPPGEQDVDQDGHGLCFGLGDCNDSIPAAWAPPGEAIGPNFVDVFFLQWSPPPDPGGSVVYDLLRSDDPISFVDNTVCVRYSTTMTFWEEETAEPALDHFFSYVVRVRNFCPAGQNLNMGTDSAGAPRVGRSCP